MKILEQLWYGNIEPMEYDTSSKEYKKLQELICRNEEKLKATMTDEQKELFEKYTDCVREYQTITDYLRRCEKLEEWEDLSECTMSYIFYRKDCTTH